MLRNYLKIAIRHLQKQKVFAFINVFGLAVGIACFSLLILFVTHERSFDRFHRNAANIYRLYTVWDPKLLRDRETTYFTDIRLIATAFFIAAPLAWMLMHRWLADYAERITINWMIFAGVGLLTALLAVMAIGHQAIRAAMANPVNALKQE